ncbi:MAG TPA: mechanosensitive ion channel domain-containing protein [Xanthomonadales bacterium]|nr:mechanosensitive ion channel domain-containing protein [Xanthomonadales bacterium]
MFDQIINYVTSDEFIPMITDWGLKLVLALVIFIVGRLIAKLITKAFRKAINRESIDDALEAFLGNILYAILMVSVILASLDTLGVNITSLLAIVGAAGLAIGLALKDSLGNFAAGVMLIIFRPFTKGDFVEAAGVSGKVDEIRIFNTVLTTPDNKQITIPNALINADAITNYSAMDQRRVDLVIGVGYDDDLKLARDVITRVVTSHDKVLEEPAFAIFVSELADSSVNFNVRPWCRTDDYWAVYGDLLESIKVELDAEGLNIPYPQTDVHLHKVASG